MLPYSALLWSFYSPKYCIPTKAMCVRGLGWRLQAMERDYVTVDYGSIVQIPSLNHPWIILAWRILSSLSVKQTLSSFSVFRYISFLLLWPPPPFNLAHQPTTHILCVHFLCKSRINLCLTFGSFWTSPVRTFPESNYSPIKEFYKTTSSPGEFIHRLLKYLFILLPFHL